MILLSKNLIKINLPQFNVIELKMWIIYFILNIINSLNLKKKIIKQKRLLILKTYFIYIYFLYFNNIIKCKIIEHINIKQKKIKKKQNI
jgi:hypothetical protein